MPCRFVNIHQSTRLVVPEGLHLQEYRWENLRFLRLIFFVKFISQTLLNLLIFIKTPSGSEASDAFMLSYCALTSELCPSVPSTIALFPQVSAGNCHSLEDSLADSPCPRLYKVKNISPPMETLWTKFCSEGSADS
jgi:hypothetical protein